jgi:hypothetical protein
VKSAMRLVWRYTLTLLSAALVLANWNDTSRGIDLNKLRPFPLTRVRAGRLRDGETKSFGGLVATSHGGEVLLRGAAKSGKRWSARFGEVAFDQVYTADVDGNGIGDYVIYGLLPGANGRTAPDAMITVLLMDTDGLPTPYQTYVYDSHPEHGPRILIDLLHNGHAQLLVSSYDESMWDRRVEALSSGHWIHQVLEPKDMRWVEYRGSALGFQFPLVYRWSYWPQNALESPRRVLERVSMPERSTAISEISAGQITRAEESTFEGIHIAPSLGCVGFRVDTVVLDEAASRQIALYDVATYYETGLLRRMKRDGTTVQLFGLKHNADHTCRATMLWGGT